MENLRRPENRVFLGGTCNESNWRNEIIDRLKIDYFNPVVDDWNDECYKRELYEKEVCKYLLFVITPRMTGVYSIAEVIDCSNKFPERTIFCYLPEDDSNGEYYEFDYGQRLSLDRVGEMVVNNGGYWCETLDDVITLLNRG